MAIEWVVGWQSPRVHALVTHRHGAGVSQPPFDSFNLGDRCGDDPAAVAANRAALAERAELPSPPRWLRQVHGTHVHPFTNPPAGTVGAGAAGDRPAPAFPEAKLPTGTVGAGAAGDRPAPAFPEAKLPTGTVGAGVAGDRPAPVPTEAPGAPEGAGRRQRRLLQSGAEGGGVPEADAAVTVESGIVLAVLTADCLPVVLAARDGSEVAVAHAGWRGLAAGVLEATIAAMRTPAADTEAWLGPAAGPLRYEVGEEVRDAFLSHAAAEADAAAAFVATRPGHWLCDLYALARLRLGAAGVTAVRGGERCTIGEPDAFFSHRRDGRSGRQATLAWLA